MFGKKKCRRCGERISEKFDYCPICGTPSKSPEEKREEWGMFGKTDFETPFNEIKLPMGLNMIFNSLMKNLEKEFRNIDREFGREIKGKEENNKIKKSGISISISAFGNKAPEIRVQQFGDDIGFKEIKPVTKAKQTPSKTLSTESIKRFSKLPREEPLTNVRRLSNKIVYEIDMPGVRSIKDVSIIKLENSIEIKAVAKDKAYFKLLPIKLPIIDYKISDGKLLLELETRG